MISAPHDQRVIAFVRAASQQVGLVYTSEGLDMAGMQVLALLRSTDCIQLHALAAAKHLCQYQRLRKLALPSGRACTSGRNPVKAPEVLLICRP